MAGEAPPTYLIAVYVLVPMVLVVLLALLLYVCCSRTYRLNWFERTLLEEGHIGADEEEEGVGEKQSITNHGAICPAATTTSPGFLHRASKYSPLPGDVNASAFPGSSAGMGSNPSTPASTDSGGGGGGGVGLGSGHGLNEQFWVPPSTVQKKRAQSLTPNIGTSLVGMIRNDSDEGSIGAENSTPTSSTSLQEMTFNFPPGLTESVSLVPTPAQRQRRRASMQDALDHTKINTKLYERSEEDSTQQPQLQQSIGSIQEENLGSINFSLDYNMEQGLLTVRLITARDLSPRDFNSSVDPYCRVCLLPNKKTYCQSRVHRKTACPEFEEEFLFEVLPSNLASRTLEVLIFDYDQFSRDECIGQVHLPLENVDLSEKVTLWKGISPYEKTKEEIALGDIMFSLGYLSTAERLTVVILKARNLKAGEDTRAHANPFVKVTLLFGGKRIKKKKTSAKRNTNNPIWNEALVFSVGNESLRNVCVELAVYSDNLLGNDDLLGKVVVGPETSGEEISHWNDMINCKTAMARWHHLLRET